MNYNNNNPWDEFSGGEQPSPIKRQLQGPRPAPLKLHKNSHKIKKPPLGGPAPPKPPLPPEQRRQPVIIYDVSPKVIHATETEFMTLVQRLTGPTTSGTGAGAGAVSPAARLASIEKTSPPERGRERAGAGVELMGFEGGYDQFFPGILSPAPASLTALPAAMFSPGYEVGLMNDLGPYLGNMFTPSPSSLLQAPLVTPSPSSFDILSQFFDL